MVQTRISNIIVKLEGASKLNSGQQMVRAPGTGTDRGPGGDARRPWIRIHTLETEQEI